MPKYFKDSDGKVYRQDGNSNDIWVEVSEEEFNGHKQIAAKSVALTSNLPAPATESNVLTFGRCGNVDRDNAQMYVDQSWAGGYLDDGERDARTAYITAAKTHAQLAEITADLGLPLDKWLKNRRDRELFDLKVRQEQETERLKALEREIVTATVVAQAKAPTGELQVVAGALLVVFSVIPAALLAVPLATPLVIPFLLGIFLLRRGYLIQMKSLTGK